MLSYANDAHFRHGPRQALCRYNWPLRAPVNCLDEARAMHGAWALIFRALHGEHAAGMSCELDSGCHWSADLERPEDD